MLANVSSHEAAVMNETFSKIWAEVRNSVTAGDDENWIGLSRGVGVTKEDLTSAAEKLPSIRDFFMQVLNRRPPKAQEVATPFHMRLRELQAEIVRESLEADHQSLESDGASGREPMSRHASDSSLLRPAPSFNRSASSKVLGMSSKKTLTGYKAKYNHAISNSQMPSRTRLPPIKGATM